MLWAWWFLKQIQCSLTCQHLFSAGQQVFAPAKKEPPPKKIHFSHGKDSDLPSSKSSALKAHRWQSNHYKAWTESRDDPVFPWTNRVISTFRVESQQGGEIATLGGLISVRVCEAMKRGGKPSPVGKGTNGRAITEISRGQVAFSSPSKALGENQARHKGQALC